MSSTNSNSSPIDKDLYGVILTMDLCAIDRHWVSQGGTGLERPQIDAVLKDLEHENERIKREVLQPMSRDANSEKLAKFIMHITPVICYVRHHLGQQLRVELNNPIAEHATEPPRMLVILTPPPQPPVPELRYQIAEWSLKAILEGWRSLNRSILPKKWVMHWDLDAADELSPGKTFTPNDNQLGDFDLAGCIHAFGFDGYQGKTIDLGTFDSS